MCLTYRDTQLLAELGLTPDDDLDLSTATATVDAVLEAAGETHTRVRTRPGVRVDGAPASREQARAIFELLTAGLARRTRDGRVRLTRAGRAWRHQLRRKGVVPA